MPETIDPTSQDRHPKKLDPHTLEIVIRLLKAIRNDADARACWKDSTGHTTINDRQLIDAIGNRMFITMPEPFGLTEQEGRELRVWFQTNVTSADQEFYAYLQAIIEEEVYRDV